MTRWSFDDNWIGIISDGDSVLSSKIIERPVGVSTLDWYDHASKVCKMLTRMMGE